MSYYTSDKTQHIPNLFPGGIQWHIDTDNNLVVTLFGDDVDAWKKFSYKDTQLLRDMVKFIMVYIYAMEKPQVRKFLETIEYMKEQASKGKKVILIDGGQCYQYTGKGDMAYIRITG